MLCFQLSVMSLGGYKIMLPDMSNGHRDRYVVSCLTQIVRFPHIYPPFDKRFNLPLVIPALLPRKKSPDFLSSVFFNILFD